MYLLKKVWSLAAKKSLNRTSSDLASASHFVRYRVIHKTKEPKEPFQNHRCEKREASTLLQKTQNNLYLLPSLMYLC